MVVIAIGFVALYLFIFMQLKQTESQLTSYGNVTDSAIGNFLENLSDDSAVKLERTVEGISLVVKGGEGSSLNADLFDGKDSSYFTDAGNIKSGTLPDSSYSAWNDLTAEGFIHNGKIKSEYLPTFTSSGSTTTGISWNDIQNRPTGLDDGDDSSTLSESQIEGYITNGALELDSGTTLGGNTIASQSWVTSQNYLTTINFSQVSNGTGVYLDYRPNNSACGQGEVLKYDAGLNRWVCGVDTGAGALAWGGITGSLTDQVDLNAALTSKLGTSATFGGDISGTYNNISVSDDTHNHTGATISGLGVADFASPNISQWTNDAGFISELNHAQITNGSGIYWDYRPNNTSCAQDQVLKYDAGLSRWACATDAGATSTTWGAITGTLANQTDLNNALNGKLGTGAAFVGDVSGTYNNIAIVDDSHNHTGATISGLTTTDFTTQNISQWANDMNYITGVNYAQVANGPNIYMNYKPNDVACSQDQTLKYDSSLSRWVCGNDNGAGTIAWGSITGTLANQSDLSTALSSKLNLTASFGGDISGTYDNIVVANDSHSHTGASLTAIDIAQVVSGSGKYFNYKPNDVACSNGQILEYDSTNSRWVCANDDLGSGGSGGNGEVVIIANDLAPTGTTLNETINFTTTTTGNYLLYATSTAYTTAIAQKTLVAKIDGNTVGNAGIYMNSTNFHYSLPPVIVKLTNLAAGAHTLNLSITGTHTVDVNDRIHAYVMAVGGGTSGTAVNIQRASGTTDVNTTSTTFVDMPDMTVTMTTSGNPIEINFSAGVGSTTANAVGLYRIQIDGITVGTQTKVRVDNATIGGNANLIWTATPVAGQHTVKVQWSTDMGTLYNRAAAGSEHRTLIVKEFLGGSGGGGGTATVGSMTGTSVFADATADDDWLGLGASAAKIEFDDQTTDEILLLNSNVGIGTSTPTSTLSVNGNISIPTQSLGTQPYRMNIGTYGTISETAGGLAYITGNAVAASLTANNQIVKTANDAGQFMRMRYDTGISFHTNITGGTGTSMSDSTNSRMFIGLDGKVGINTTTPQFQFHVQTPDNSLAYIGNNIITNGHYSGLAIGYSEPGPVYAKSAIVQEQLGDGAARAKVHILNDGTLDNSNATLADARLTINYDGKVGIGNTSPGHLLDVNGNVGIAASGYLNFGTTDGSGGYGLRDNAGVIEVKDSTGTWAAVVEEAPTDGKYYVRKDGAWVQVPTTDPSWSDASMQLYVGGTQVTLSSDSKQRYKINNGIVTIVASLKAAAGVNLTGNFQVRNLPVLPINTSTLQLLGTGEWRNENTGYYTTRMMFESSTGYLLPKMYNDYAILSSTMSGNENDLLQFTVTYETNQGLGFNSPLNVAETDGSPSVSGVGNITVPNGTLTNNGNGQVFLDYGSARADKLYDQVAGAGGQATFDLSGIYGDYYMIKIYITGRHDTASSPNTSIFLHFNNDSTEANYTSGASRDAGGTHYSYSTSDSRIAIVPAATAARPLSPGQCEITIVDPFNTTFEKQARSTCGMRFSTASEYWAYYMQWNSAAAINRVTLVPNLSGNFSQGTRVIVVGYK